MASPTVTTSEQLLALDEPGCRHELVRGELRRRPFATMLEGSVGSNLMALLPSRKVAHDGYFVVATGFLLEQDPDTVCSPAIAYVRRERVPPLGDGYVPGPPELAIEVCPSADRGRVMSEKVRRWLDHGTRLVWVVDPIARTVAVHEPSGSVRLLGTKDDLTGGSVLPGYTVRVHELFSD